MWSTFVHRWRRPILHVIAGGAIVGSGAVGVARGPLSLHSGDTSPSQVEVRAEPRFESLADATSVQSGGATVALTVQPAPDATPDVVEDTATGNAAAPSAPDAPLAIRTYSVEEGDTVRTIATQFGVTNETIIWQNDLTDPDILQVGQELHILPFSGLIHEVRPGDTLASVANGYDALIADVIGANKLSAPYIIVVGQKLAVPGGYRPLPRKVVVAPGPDVVQAPGESAL